MKPTPEPCAPIRRPFRVRRWLVLILIACIAAIGGGLVLADWWICLPSDAQPTYVGRQACIECHQEYDDQWQGSHHDLAMDLATPETVLADFENVEFEHHGIKSRMFRRQGKYWVHTEGPEGEMADFEVKYVFGVDPLQQFMVEFDRPADMPDDEVARVQVLRLTWDTNREEWFYLPPPDVREKLEPNDELHWTGIAQRWNNMCADCHSTNLQKRFDVDTNLYHTTFSEIDVSCETCHGPASLHVELARSKSLFWDRQRGYGLVHLKDDQKALIQTCAPCHSRRRMVYPGFRPGDNYYDYFDNELLMQATYHADGQILDEDYVYGSFIQSKMYHKGIHCTDCHNPHTAKLKHDANQVCTSCHQHPAGKYDGPSHHHHQPGSVGALCVECHMPETTYMEVDPRRDHSIRNPRPDLSVDLGTPNACSRCHIDKHQAGFQDRDDLRQYQDWLLAARHGDQQVKDYLGKVDSEMAEACREWYGDQRKDDSRPAQHFSYAIEAARRGEPQAESALVRLAGDSREAAIVRATALMELNRFASRRSLNGAVELLDDPNPQVRSTAIGNLQGRLDEAQLTRTLAPLLEDPVRLVRTEAARVLAPLPRGALNGAQRKQLDRMLAEYERGVLTSNDRAGAHIGLGILYEGLGSDEKAKTAYETAIRVEPRVTGPRTNLAALYDRLAESADRRANQALLLNDTRKHAAALEEAGRCRERAKQFRREELECLARDVRLMPDTPVLQYRYGMLLYLHRRLEQAEEALSAAHRLEPTNPQFLLGLVLFYKEMQKPDEAIPLARKLIELRPEDGMYRQILKEIMAMKSAIESNRPRGK